MVQHSATTRDSLDWTASMSHKVIAFAMLPFTLLLLLLLSAVAIATLPMSYVYYLIIEPRRIRQQMREAGRLIDESECLERLGRGEGTLIVHQLNAVRFSGIQDLAWYTDDVIEAPSAPEAEPDLDTLTDEQARELGSNAVVWDRIYRKYARTSWGTSKLVRASGAMAFARRVREQCATARVITVSRYRHLLGPFEMCRACQYPLSDIESLRCPECGKRNGLPRPPRR